MNPENKPKLRVSLYHYSDDFIGFLLAFRTTAIKQGWTYQELQRVVFDKTENMTYLEMFNFLMQYAVIVKCPKEFMLKTEKEFQTKKSNQKI